MSQLKLDVELMYPPSLVWRALTESRLLNEWFQPITGWPESGARPGSQGRVFPTDDLTGFGAFEMDMVVADPYSWLVTRWRGDDFTSELTFEIRPVPDGGSRLLVGQAGFLGTQEVARRDTLSRAHVVMIERLRAALDRLSWGAGEGDFLRAGAPEPLRHHARRPRTDHRIRFVAVVCAAIVAGLCGTAGAVWMNRDKPTAAPLFEGAASGEPSLGEGALPPAASDSPTRSPAGGGTGQNPAPTSAAAPVSTRPASKPLVAGYQTHALPVGLLGFDTQVTVRNPDGAANNGWTVVLKMPDATAVDNRSAAVVTTRQDGDVVTVTPVAATLAGGASVTFTIRFPALIALGQSIKSCTIDGKACAAG